MRNGLGYAVLLLGFVAGYLLGSIVESVPRVEPPPYAAACDLTMNCLECHARVR